MLQRPYLDQLPSTLCFGVLSHCIIIVVLPLKVVSMRISFIVLLCDLYYHVNLSTHARLISVEKCAPSTV